MAVNCTSVRDRAVPLLHGQAIGSLTVASSDDIFRSFNAALGNLARFEGFGAGSLVLSLTGGNPLVALPARHVSTIYAAVRNGSGPWSRLTPWTRARLEAYDPSFAAASAALPTHYVQEMEGGQMRVYPTPTSGLTLALIYAERPADVSTGSPTLSAAPPVGDYLLYRAIGDARRKNSDEGMADVAAFCDEQTAIYEALFRAYWSR